MKKTAFLASILLAGIALPSGVLAQSAFSDADLDIIGDSHIEQKRQSLENAYASLASDLNANGMKRLNNRGIKLNSPKYGEEYSTNPLPYDLKFDSVLWNGNEFIVKLTGSFEKTLAKKTDKNEIDVEFIYETLNGQWEPLGISEKVRFFLRTDASDDYFELMPDPTPEEIEEMRRIGQEAERLYFEKLDSTQGHPAKRSKNLPMGGILAGKKISVSAGHGWVQGIHWQQQYTSTGFGLQRSANCRFDAETEGIIEDHSNAKFVNQWLIPMLENMGAEVINVREPDLNTEADVVIDNTDPGFSKTGSWIDSTYAGDGNYRYFYGSNTTVSKEATAKATWTHTFSTSGPRVFQAWYGEEGDRSSKVKYTIKDAAGEHTVYVNQRLYGRFRDLGKYWCAAGVPCSVTVENVANDGFLVADALKMGAGKEKITGASHPWWQMDSYYYVHKYVLNTNSELATYSPSLRREYALHAKADMILSVHSNASNGDCTANKSGGAQGLWMYAPPSMTASTRLYGTLLRSAILDSLWDKFDPGFCSMGGLHEQALGEINTSAIPAILVEMAYHDNTVKRASCSVGDDSINTGKSPRYSDNEALQMPQFREAMARGIADGIAQYFAIKEKGGSASDYKKFAYSVPVRPKGVRAINNTSESSITVSWDAADGAEGYVVYKIDNLRPSYEGAWDEGTFVKSGTSYTFKNLEPGRVYAFKVAGINKIGEGYTSPSVAARLIGTGHKTRGLYVNGFTRWDAKVTHEVNTLEYASQHGIALGAVADDFYFDGAMSDAVENGSVSLKNYKVIDLETGRNNGKDDTVTAKMQNVLTTYMNEGGNLLISGGEIGWALVAKGGGTTFFNNILKASFTDAQDDANVFTAAGTGDFAAIGNIAIDDGTHGTYKAMYSDAFTPASGSKAVINYSGSAVSGAAAVASDHVVLVGFPIETIYADQKRAEVVGCAIDKLAYGKSCTPANHKVLADGAKATKPLGSETVTPDCTDGDTVCKDASTLKTCKAGKWTESACPTDQKCENKACVAKSTTDPVTPECTDGDVVCKDASTLKTCKAGKWTESACPTNQKCEANACVAKSDTDPVTPECTEGDAYCKNSSTLLSCTGGTWVESTCNADQFCINDTCRANDAAPECNDGDKECVDENTSKTCKNGFWSVEKCQTGYACGKDAVCEKTQGSDDDSTDPIITAKPVDDCSAMSLKNAPKPSGLWMILGLFGLVAIRRRRAQ